MHLAQRVLDAERRDRRVRVGRHDAHDAARLGVEARGNDAQDDVLGREDARDLLVVDALHDADGRRALLAHDARRLAHARLDADGRGRRARVENRAEVRERHLVAQGLDVREERVRRAGVDAAKLLLCALERRVESLRRAVCLFELLERLVEDLGDVEETDDVALLVADGLRGD